MGIARHVSLSIVLLLSSTALATEITPKPEVTIGVVIRARPTARSAREGLLRPGQRLQLIEDIGTWYVVTLPNGKRGHVSKRWTTIADESFSIHFVDVGTGDAILIRSGTTEIVIDGGEHPTRFANYVRERNLIHDPVELLILTHADTDHWAGLRALLGYPRYERRVIEFWEPGYNRSCAPLPSYDEFMQWMQRMPSVRVCRPLSACYATYPHRVALAPDIVITILHANARPAVRPCAYTINSASIVVLLEIRGVRVLLTGDATGKARTERADVTPKYVEAHLLALARRHVGLLRADILKVPRHGSETSSTNDFIAAVNPHFVIISASTRHHLPQQTVVARYENGERVVLRTDADRRSNNDHIVCRKSNETELECNYEDVLNDQ